MPSTIRREPFMPNIVLKGSRRMVEGIRSGHDEDPLSKSHSRTKQQRPPKTITRLIANRNWWQLENILNSSSFEKIDIDEKGIIDENAVVQFALRYNAPLHIIKLLAHRFPKCLTRPDSTGKYACHVAGKYGAMPNVMEYLIEENRDAAGVQDPAGKAPIHYVAEFYASTHESASHSSLIDNMIQVVRLLREAAPKSFNLEDNEGCNAIEYAIENDVDIKVIKTIQRTARDDWRAMKASGQGMKHEDLEKEVYHAASQARVNVLLSDRLPERKLTSRSSSRKLLPENNLKRSFVAKSA